MKYGILLCFDKCCEVMKNEVFNIVHLHEDNGIVCRAWDVKHMSQLSRVVRSDCTVLPLTLPLLSTHAGHQQG